MRFYLAAAYDRKEEMQEVRDALGVFGYEVTSRWIDGHPEINSGDIISIEMLNDPNYLKLCREVANHDLSDIALADAMISFNGHTNQGGRHVEFGYALGLGMPVFIIGKRENLFHVDQNAVVFEDFESFLHTLVLNRNVVVV